MKIISIERGILGHHKAEQWTNKQCLWEDEYLRVGASEGSPMLEEQTSEGTDSKLLEKIKTTHHRHWETTMPKDLEDTSVSSEGSRTSFEDHRA